MIFLKKVIGRALKNIADSLKIFKLDALGFIVDYLIKVLIAKSELDIKPILCLALFFKYIKDSKPHCLTSGLSNVLIRYIIIKT